jgi:type IV pilus assembly protein PilC
MKRRGEAGPRDARRAVERLAMLAAAGVPTSQALAVAARTPGAPGRVLAALARDAARGGSLAAALRRRPTLFATADAALVAAAERSGVLTEGLSLLARNLAERAEGRRRLRRAMTYPVVLLGFALAALGFLAVVVLPSFATLYGDDPAALPWSTRTLMWVGAVLPRAVLGTTLAAAVANFAVGRLVARSTRAAWWWERCQLGVPLVGPAREAADSERLYALLAGLLATGCEADLALAAARDSTGPVLAGRIDRALALLARGRPLSRAWRACGIDPAGEESSLLELAEATGGYAAAFSQLAALRRARREDALATLTAALEPAAVAVMGAVAAVGVLALYQPVLGSAARMLGGAP